MATWAEFEREDAQLVAFGRDARYALHSPMDNPDGVGGEFLIARGTRTPLAFYALSVEEAVATTYEGTDRDPVYRRWRPS